MHFSTSNDHAHRREQWRGRRRRTATAFTLIELLVSMTVTLLLVVLLLRVFSAAANSWQHGEAQVDGYREARGALQLMARDLGATLQADYAQSINSTTGAATTSAPVLPTLVLERNPNTTPDPSGPINEEVYCLTNIPNSGSSTLCAVGYFCQWMPDFLPVGNDRVDHRPRAYALMRQSLDSNATFQRLQNASLPVTFANLFSLDGTPAPSVTQLAAYVWDLRFRIDTDLNETKYPDGNAPVPLDHAGVAYSADGTAYPRRLPPYLEIRFKALSEVAGRRLEGSSTGVTKATWRDTDAGFTAAGLYQQIILPNAQQFVLRVPLNNATPLPTATPSPSP